MDRRNRINTIDTRIPLSQNKHCGYHHYGYSIYRYYITTRLRATFAYTILMFNLISLFKFGKLFSLAARVTSAIA